jgi:cation diffusion facilitator CzcD-associated flavoprotein CzcO
LKLILDSFDQLADWLESYAKIMELNVWTSSVVTSAEKDSSGSGGWIVNLTRTLPDGTESRRVLRPTHLAFATGLGSGSMVMPNIPKKVTRALVYLPLGARH